MPIDPFAEQTVTLALAARRLPSLRAGRPVNPATLWRWSSHGIRGVKLETCKIGGTTCTSVEALRRFFAALGSPPESASPPLVATPGRIEAELDSIGI